MAYPSLLEYNEAFQHPDTALSDPILKNGNVKRTGLGLPLALCGGFALTYLVSNGTNKYAVRCFQRASTDLQLRYREISRQLQTTRSPYFINCEFQLKGVRVNGTWYPIVKMDWAKGITLGEFIEKNYSDQNALRYLIQSLSQLSAFLERLKIAHGDIQPGNVMVSDGGKKLQLIDYDGMFIPSLSSLGSSELGLPNFQHPKRTSQSWDHTLDRFSFIAINLALRTLELDPSLWKKTHSDSETILFTTTDYHNPESSAVFAELFKLSEIRRDAEAFAAICKSPFNHTPTLSDFLIQKNRPSVVITAKPTISFGERQYYSSLEVLDASDYQGCLPSVGKQVEIVGKITSVKHGRAINHKPYIFVNFGDWRGKIVKIAIWSDSLSLLDELPDDTWVGDWVSVIGLIDPPYTSDKFYYTHLTINITQTNQIHHISKMEAERRLNNRWTPPATPKQQSTNERILAQIKPATAAIQPQVRTPSNSPSVNNNNQILQSVRTSTSSTQARSTTVTPQPTKLVPQSSSKDVLKQLTAEQTFKSDVPQKPVSNQPSPPSEPQVTTPTQQSQTRFCFIATALYGEKGIETSILRDYRDRKLLPTWYGRTFVKAYYKVSPHLVQMIEKNNIVNRIARFLVDHLVKTIEKSK